MLLSSAFRNPEYQTRRIKWKHDFARGTNWKEEEEEERERERKRVSERRWGKVTGKKKS
jgi:hypothetical protein